ncbi:MAG: outer membrane beta-barrel protein [Bacteroidales bacterium]
MKPTIAFFAFFLLLAGTANAQEDKRFGVEFNGGLSVATQTLDDTRLNPGFGFEGLLHYRILPHAGVYAGWGWNRFGASESFAGPDVCFEETGYVFGLQFKHPLGDTRMRYALRAGGLYNHIETENAAGDILDDTGHGLGWQVAGGLELPLGENWCLLPGLKFNSLSRESGYEGIERELNHRYVSLRLGISTRF